MNKKTSSWKPIRIFAVLLVTLVACASYVTPLSAMDSYVYSYKGEYQKSLPLYLPEKTVNLSEDLEIPLSKPSDICFDANGDIYITDTNNNRIIHYDNNQKLKRIISEFNNDDGKNTFSAPSGISIDISGRLLIADSNNNRIVILNSDATFSQIIGPPEGTGITAGFIYKPIAVAASPDGRVYVVSSSSNMGVLSFGADGVFEGFLGVQPVTFSPADMFWRTFMTRAQRERTTKNIPVDFSDISLDVEGFLFAVSPAIDKTAQYQALISGKKTSDNAPIKRLNPAGDDILKRNGFFPPAGDLEIDRTVSINISAAAFSSIAVDENGIYSVIDSANQRIFTYSQNGDLLSIFGGRGSSLGMFRSASAIAYYDKLPIILDSETATITVYRMSEYGSLVNEALGLQSERKYEEALLKWQEVLALNANLDSVYLDMGKAYLRAGDYNEAMECFRLVGEKEYYSKALAEKRSGYMQWMIILVPAFLILIFVGFSVLLKKVTKANQYDDMHPSDSVSLKKQLQYSFVPLFHPFDGFYAIKRHKRGGVRGATFILAAASSAVIIYRYFAGYLYSGANISESNILFEMVKFIFPFAVFMVANYGVTSLFDGEGSFKDIFITISYSLLPLLLILPIATIAANFMTLEESVILSLLQIVAYGWSFVLIFSGLITIHQYGLLKNVAATLFSLLGMLIISFLLMLFASLTQKFAIFIQNVITELTYRL